MNSRYSSTRPSAISSWTRVMLPVVTMSLPCCSLSAATSSAIEPRTGRSLTAPGLPPCTPRPSSPAPCSATTDARCRPPRNSAPGSPLTHQAAQPGHRAHRPTSSCARPAVRWAEQADGRPGIVLVDRNIATQVTAAGMAGCRPGGTADWRIGCHVRISQGGAAACCPREFSPDGAPDSSAAVASSPTRTPRLRKPPDSGLTCARLLPAQSGWFAPYCMVSLGLAMVLVF
jgi:hypothetical protein